MPSIVPRVIAGAIVVWCFAIGAATGYAQTPGAPQVTVLADNSVIISYEAPVPPPGNTMMVATFNGQPVGPFTIGTATTFSSGGPLPPGAYTVQIVWGDGITSPVTSFTISGSVAGGAPPATVMRPAIVTGNDVLLNWDPIPNATIYELEAVRFESNERFLMTLGAGQTTLAVPNVPFGNYRVRVRGRNSLGAGPYSNEILVTIGSSIRIRDLEVTLTWNSLADMDLHIIEPNGRHVSWERRDGVSVTLDRDNTAGFGPETAFIPPNGSIRGVYYIYIVHYRREFPTTSTISVSLNVGTSNVRTEIFTRQTEEPDTGVGYNVALVDPRSGMIGEIFGTRAVAELNGSVKPEQ
jgi:hypothetical protein